MTNKTFFNSLCETKLYIGNFVVSFTSLLSYRVKLRELHFTFEVFSITGKKLPLNGSVVLTPRCIHTDFYYTDANLCKFSPYELREWCPAIFNPWSNHLHWRKFMKVALEIFVESNPKILQS